METAQTHFASISSESDPLQLFSGDQLVAAEVAYETYGALNEAKDNAILVSHDSCSIYAAAYNCPAAACQAPGTPCCETAIPGR